MATKTKEQLFAELTGGTAAGTPGVPGSGGQVQGVSPYGFQGFVAGSQTVLSVEDEINKVYKWKIGGKEYNEFVAKLRKWGIVGKEEQVTPGQVTSIWTTAVTGANKFFTASGGINDMTPEEYLQAYSIPEKSTGVAVGTKTVDKNVNLYDPGTIKTLIENTISNVLNRKPTEAELKEFNTAVADMIAKGTITTRVKTATGYNTTTENKFSQAGAEQMITQKLEEENPLEVQRQKAFEFSTELNKLMSGGM